MTKYKTFVDVYINTKEQPIATIKAFEDEKHPNRKWCYKIGFHTYYSETAKTLNDMVNEYIQNEIDWLYCASHDIEVKFVSKMEEVE